jgi:hypothetical protein
MRYQRVSVFPPYVMAGLEYDPETGSFQYWDCEPEQYVAKRDGVFLVIHPFEARAHRLVLALLGFDETEMQRYVVVHVDEDKRNNRLSNLVPMPRSDYMRFAFWRRRFARLGDERSLAEMQFYIDAYRVELD